MQACVCVGMAGWPIVACARMCTSCGGETREVWRGTGAQVLCAVLQGASAAGFELPGIAHGAALEAQAKQLQEQLLAAVQAQLEYATEGERRVLAEACQQISEGRTTEDVLFLVADLLALRVHVLRRAAGGKHATLHIDTFGG